MKKYVQNLIFIALANVFVLSCSDSETKHSKVVDTYICIFDIENLNEIGDENLDISSEVMDISAVIKVNEDIRMNTVFVVYDHNETNATIIASKIQKVNNAVYKPSLISDSPVDIEPNDEELDDEDGISV